MLSRKELALFCQPFVGSASPAMIYSFEASPQGQMSQTSQSGCGFLLEFTICAPVRTGASHPELGLQHRPLSGTYDSVGSFRRSTRYRFPVFPALETPAYCQTPSGAENFVRPLHHVSRKTRFHRLLPLWLGHSGAPRLLSRGIR